MQHERYRFLVEVDRDPVPGWGHQPEDFRKLIEDRLPEHYNPTVVYLPWLVRDLHAEDRARLALRPFVEAYERGSYPQQDSDNPASPEGITVGHYRAAAKALGRRAA